MGYKLAVNPDELAQLCLRHHINKLSLFGSVLSGTAGPESDIDLLVEFEAGHVPGLLRLAGIEAEISDLLGGRRVDLRTENDLSRYFREAVLKAAEVQYPSP
jgi:predicted nucleotidyltransferase